MRFQPEKNHLLRSMILSLITFLLIIAGVALLLDISLHLQLIAVYFVFSLLTGFLYLILSGYRLTYVLFLYMTGLLVGFIEMYRAFWQGLEGWGEILGLLALGIWPTLGIILGTAVQLAVAIYNKSKAKGKKDR